MDLFTTRLSAYTVTLVVLWPAACVSSSVVAQDGLVLEEVVVTAQKRAQGVQDIPLSIGVVSGESLEQFGVSSTADLDNFVPGLIIQEGPSNLSTITVRGVGTAAGNESFDQSVSLFVDGVYAGRQREFSSALYDIERIEVIKGTQNTLLGKNTSLGAISLITKKPGAEFSGFIDISDEQKFDSSQVIAALDVPLVESFRLRLAGNHVDQGGYVLNTYDDKKYPQIRSDSFRLSGIIDINDATELSFVYQKDNSETFGHTFQLTQDDSGTVREWDPTSELKLDLQQASYVSAGRNGVAIDDHNAARGNVTLKVVINDYEFNFINGYSEYRNYSVLDSDFSAGDFLISQVDSTYQQFTQELRIASPPDGFFEYILGYFSLDGNITRYNPIRGDYTSTIDSTQELMDLFRRLVTTGQLNELIVSLLDGEVVNDFEQETRAQSLFGQSTIFFTEALRLTTGLRFTKEQKRVRSVRTAAQPSFFSMFIYPPFPESHLLHREDAWDGSVNLQYDVYEDIMLYISWGKGTKSGGFAEATTDVDNAEYEAEVAKTREVGAKMKLLGGRGTFNVAFFQTDIENFQLVKFTGLGFETESFQAVSKGYEWDGTFLIAPGLAVYGGFTKADVTDKHTHLTLARSPKITGNLGVHFEMPIPLGLKVSADVSLNKRGKMYHELNEQVPSGAVTRYDARVGIGDQDSHWELALLGKNLTNEIVSSYGFATPVVFDSSSIHESVEAPRTVAVQLRLSF